MPEAHERTRLSRESLSRRAGWLDWEAQPGIAKRYPAFLPRVKAEAAATLAWLFELRFVTEEQALPDGPYRRLNVPSAGNLHPVELYAQIRGVEGVASGIYHLDTLTRELVQIREIGREGLEPLLGMRNRWRGVVVMVAIAPFRSWWKYGLRSWRYVFLDAGHQVGALLDAAACGGEPLNEIAEADFAGLNRAMGFREEEFVCAAFVAGEATSRAVTTAKPLMHVLPTHYTEGFEPLQAWLRLERPRLSSLRATPVEAERLRALYARRRSARRFGAAPLNETQVRRLMRESDASELNATVLILRADGYESGLYAEGVLRRSGYFAREIAARCVGQSFLAGSAMVVLLSAERADASAYMAAGMLAQRLYMLAADEGLGCSGVGAYFDDELAEFAGVDASMLYVVALGA